MMVAGRLNTVPSMVADENYYGATLGLPAVVLGPLGGNHHAPDEWVSLSSLQELVTVYRQVLIRFDEAVV